MKGIVANHRTKCLISKEEIQKKVRELAERISEDYNGKDLICVGILNGAYMFYTDLTRNLDIDIQSYFLRFSSYTNNVRENKVAVILDVGFDPKGKHILIIEDVIDTGNTFYQSDIVNRLKKMGAESVKVATLISKPLKREKEVQIDYVGFEIGDDFIYGYGLDIDDKGRNTEEIRCIID